MIRRWRRAAVEIRTGSSRRRANRTGGAGKFPAQDRDEAQQLHVPESALSPGETNVLRLRAEGEPGTGYSVPVSLPYDLKQRRCAALGESRQQLALERLVVDRHPPEALGPVLDPRQARRRGGVDPDQRADLAFLQPEPDPIDGGQPVEAPGQPVREPSSPPASSAVSARPAAAPRPAKKSEPPAGQGSLF